MPGHWFAKPNHEVGDGYRTRCIGRPEVFLRLGHHPAFIDLTNMRKRFYVSENTKADSVFSSGLRSRKSAGDKC